MQKKNWLQSSVIYYRKDNIMKKTLLLATIIALAASSVYANEKAAQEGGFPPPPPCVKGAPCDVKGPHCNRPPKVDIEQKLKLTEEQKAKAKALRVETREQMRPIMEAIRTKTEQKEIIKNNKNMTAEAQCEQVEKLNKQIFELKKQARDLRLKNERDFESILNQKQKKTLDKIKADAKKNMSKGRKCPPPMK